MRREVTEGVSHGDKAKEKKKYIKKKTPHQKVGEVGKKVALGPRTVRADLGRLAHLLLKLSTHAVVLLDAQRK